MKMNLGLLWIGIGIVVTSQSGLQISAQQNYTGHLRGKNYNHVSKNNTRMSERFSLDESKTHLTPYQEDQYNREPRKLQSPSPSDWNADLELRDSVLCRVEIVDIQYSARFLKNDRGSVQNSHAEEVNLVTFEATDEGEDPEANQEVDFVCRLPNDDGSFDIALPESVKTAFYDFMGQDDDDDNQNSTVSRDFLVNVTNVYVDDVETQIALTKSSEFNQYFPTAQTQQELFQAQQFGGRRRRMSTDASSTLHHPVDIRLVVVLRVSYLGWEPTLSASELQGRIFGRGSNQVDISLRSQMEACSMGQVSLQVQRGTNIEHGIAEIAINREINFGNNPIRQLENEALQVAKNRIGSLNGVDHIIIVLPNTSQMLKPQGKYSFVAYGYLFGQVTVFRDEWAGSFSALAHEWGHNKGLHHSGAKKAMNNMMTLDEYGDTSGLMGYSVSDVSGPAMCFNAQKHYLLRWFESRTRRVDAVDLPWSGNLAFFGDYHKTESNQYPVLIHMSRPGLRLFFQYNKAEGINQGTSLKEDRVVVVMDKGKPGDRTSIHESLFLGAINTGGDGVFRYKNYKGSKDLNIHVCGVAGGTPSYLRVIMYLDGQANQVSCSDPEPSFCDDDRAATFFVNHKQGFQDCGWLRENIGNSNIRSNFCNKSHDAYHLCPETCEKCADACKDEAGVFFVSNNLGTKNCKWLSSQPAWQDRLCFSSSKAFDLCHETCDRCD